jgi:hypothetical protein
MRNEEKAMQFRRANPSLLEMIHRFCKEARNAGYAHYGINSIWERIRWEYDMDITRTDRFKINNNHAPYFARWFMEEYPEFAGFFHTRELTSA